MKKIHARSDVWRPEVGMPFKKAIEEILMTKTNTDNLSNKWSVTDWVRYSVAEQLKRAGELPVECKKLLKPFYKDLDL